MTDTTDHSSKAIWDAAAKFRTALLITASPAGPHARPMAPVLRPDDGLIWFLTDKASAKDFEIARDPKVTVAFSDGASHHLSIVGMATAIDDRATIKALWSAPAQAFYPGGPDDPDVMALKIVPGDAELWDGPNAVVSLVKMAAAIVTRDRADYSGDHVQAPLNPV
jgi:general stress protein 26